MACMLSPGDTSCAKFFQNLDVSCFIAAIEYLCEFFESFSRKDGVVFLFRVNLRFSGGEVTCQSPRGEEDIANLYKSNMAAFDHLLAVL